LSIKTWASNNLRRLSSAIKSGFDIRDIFLFGGLAMMGYGLYLLRPWLGWAAAGAILMAIGYLMRGK